MIRPATFVAMLVFVFAGLFLYQTKHRSQMLDREIARTMKATDDTRARASLLRAEFALLSDPSRLQDLSDQLLKLKPTQPTQYTTMADLPKRLPPIGPMPGSVPPVAEPASTEPTQTTPPPAAPAIAAAPIAAPAAPAPVAVAVTKPAPAPKPAPKPAPAPTSLAANPAPPRPPVTLASARTIEPAPPTTTAEAIRQIVRGAPVNPSVPVVASALGMARSMITPPSMAAQAATRGDVNRN